jgi:hypothetical protein
VFSHKYVPETDLKAVYLAKTALGQLWLCAELHDEASSRFPYALHLKGLNETGISSFEAHTRPRGDQIAITLSGPYFCSETSLTDLGNPWAILAGATVESPDANIPFDQTAWPLIYVQP